MLINGFGSYSIHLFDDLNNQYKKIKYKSKGTYHSKKDFPKEIKSWDIKIKNLKQSF